MCICAFAHILGSLGTAPRRAQGLSVVGDPLVLEQVTCSRPFLWVLLEALMQEVVHVSRHFGGQLRLLVLHIDILAHGWRELIAQPKSLFMQHAWPGDILFNMFATD